jgi:hypothetical protein
MSGGEEESCRLLGRYTAVGEDVRGSTVFTCYPSSIRRTLEAAYGTPLACWLGQCFSCVRAVPDSNLRGHAGYVIELLLWLSSDHPNAGISRLLHDDLQIRSLQSSHNSYQSFRQSHHTHPAISTNRSSHSIHYFSLSITLPIPRITLPV